MACIDVERFSSCTIPVRAVPKARHYYFQSLARKLQIISLELLADWNLAGTASVAWYAAGPPPYAATWTRSGLCQNMPEGRTRQPRLHTGCFNLNRGIRTHPVWSERDHPRLAICEPKAI